MSIVTAQNLLLLGYVFANMACTYALVWDITRHRRAAILGGLIFGLSPYLASHLLDRIATDERRDLYRLR